MWCTQISPGVSLTLCASSRSIRFSWSATCAVTSGPGGPWGPVAPSAPSAPAGPNGPVAPTGPAGPSGPSGPGTGSVASTASTRASRAVNSTVVGTETVVDCVTSTGNIYSWEAGLCTLTPTAVKPDYEPALHSPCEPTPQPLRWANRLGPRAAPAWPASASGPSERDSGWVGPVECSLACLVDRLVLVWLPAPQNQEEGLGHPPAWLAEVAQGAGQWGDRPVHQPKADPGPDWSE